MSAPRPAASLQVRFTDRHDGNMSLVAGDGHEHGRANQARLCAELGLDGLARGYQVHGAGVLVARTPTDPLAPQQRLPHADGQATDVPGLGAMVLSADCMPVAIGAPGAVAMVHAGWRGLAAGVLQAGVQALRSLAAEGEMQAEIGPCAGACCYEVGREVHAALGSGREGPGPVDLRAIARERLLAAGVQEVRETGGCTICDQRYFSHRREGARAGRMAAVAWLS